MSGFTPVTNAVAGNDGFGVMPIALAFVVVVEPQAHDVSERPKTSPVPGADTGAARAKPGTKNDVRASMLALTNQDEQPECHDRERQGQTAGRPGARLAPAGRPIVGPHVAAVRDAHCGRAARSAGVPTEHE